MVGGGGGGVRRYKMALPERTRLMAASERASTLVLVVFVAAILVAKLRRSRPQVTYSDSVPASCRLRQS